LLFFLETVAKVEEEEEAAAGRGLTATAAVAVAVAAAAAEASDDSNGSEKRIIFLPKRKIKSIENDKKKRKLYTRKNCKHSFTEY